MARIARFVTGRRTKWAVLGLWILLVVGTFGLASKVSKITDDRQESFLPKDAQSTKVIQLQKSEFPGGQTVNALLVYERPGGLTAADLRKIAADSAAAKRQLPVVAGTPSRPVVAPNRSLAYVVIAVPSLSDQQKQTDEGKLLRKTTGKG